MHVSLTSNVTGNGTAKAGAKSASWTQPADAVNSLTIASFARGNSGLTQSVSASAILSVDVTLTWTPDTFLPADPSPDKIVVLEQSTASASSTVNSGAQGASPVTSPGSVNDGLGDPVNANGTATGHKYVTCAVTNNKVTLPTLALSASASSPPGGTNPDGTSYLGTCSAGAGVGAVTISIHAQPHNFQQTTGIDNGDGTISFTYGWQSTSGNTVALTTCYLHERVTYPGTSDPYVPPAPFTQTAAHPNPRNPTVAPGTGMNGILMTSLSTNGDTHYPLDISSNYNDFTSANFSAAQRYEFDDVDTGEMNVLTPGPDATQTITRTIYPVGTPPDLPDWWYSVTKNSVIAKKKVASHP